MFNDGLGMAASYYAETAHAAPERPPLRGFHDADLLVVGGGCTGLVAALQAAQRGLSVIVLEGGRIGWGASGRNGGQIIPGLRLGPRALSEKFGLEVARRLFTVAVSARALVADLIAEHDIACDLTLQGHLHLTHRAGDLQELQQEASLAAELFDYPHLSVISRLDDELQSPAYRGGLLDRRGGHFHPLNYALGLAQAAEQAGVRIFEQSPALRLADDVIRADCAEGHVTARHGILACDALLGQLDRRLASRIMPIASHIVTTQPLEELPILRNRAISDSRFSVNYFRITADRRLLFGGGERFWPGENRDLAASVRPALERIFPQLRGIPFSHCWGGLVSITRTRLPDIGRSGVWLYGQGYSGQGAILSSLAGTLLARATLGDSAGVDLLALMQPKAFPGGAALRTPLHLLGMIWYGLRDRLG